MGDIALQLIKTNLDEAHLSIFGVRLREWLVSDLNQSKDDVPAFTESRAKALCRASGFVDDPTLHDFARLMENATAVRLALYDLIDSAGLDEDEEVQVLAATSNALSISNPSAGSEPALSGAKGQVLQSPISIDWLALAIAAYAWKSGYPLYQLDPSTPPEEHSPAGQLVRRTATFLRQQVQRSATERDKLGRKLKYAPGTAVANSPSLDSLPEQPVAAPIPPHYRPPIPVNYPEYSRETVTVDNEAEAAAPVVQRRAGITITEDDLQPTASAQKPQTMPPLQITHDQIPATPPARRVVTPTNSAGSGTNFNTAVQRSFGSKEAMRSVKLRIVVQEYHEGPGIYGLQVRVSCQGIKAFVAGTSNQEGVFLCELPVRVRSGLTYDVDVTWPRDFGSETERKSITLNVDRTEFTLPFYHRLSN